MIVSAHQPAYMPWLGLFDKIARSDAFCVLDTAQFSRGDFINRNRIKSPRGAIWLTVPVRAESRVPICNVRIRDDGWRRKHLAALEHCYFKAPFFDRYAPEIAAVLERPHVSFNELTAELLRVLLAQLGIGTRLVFASDCDFAGQKSQYLLDMCRRLGATSYISGTRGRDYLDASAFSSAGIGVEFQDYRHPVYPQRFGAFVANLSVLDLLFNVGPRSLDVLLGAGSPDGQNAVPGLNGAAHLRAAG
jgi:hypothetical protein